MDTLTLAPAAQVGSEARSAFGTLHSVVTHVSMIDPPDHGDPQTPSS